MPAVKKKKAGTNQEELRRQIGQLMIVGFEGTKMSSAIRRLLTTLQPGGVLLFTRNISGARQTWELLRQCRETTRLPMFLCVDMEGGAVDRLRGVIAPAPSAAQVFATASSQLFRLHGQLIGDEVRALGFNVDFAPVVDLALEPSRPVLGSRTVSAEARETVTYAREFLRGLRSAGILGCGKHFPGLGEANLDTHQELPAIPKSWARLWAEDLLPYRLLHPQFSFVMVAHAAFPQVTGDALPASLSRKWLTDILRKKIGYRGLIMADDLEMGGVLAAASIEDAAVETLLAGADIFPVCHNENQVWRSFEGVLRAAEQDRKLVARIRQAANHILAFKKKAHQLTRKAPPPLDSTIQRLRAAMLRFSEQLQKTGVRP